VARKLETAIVLVLEGASPFDTVRGELDPSNVARGIPFHITLLYPFTPRSDLSDALLDDTRSFFEEQEPLEVTLTTIQAFPGVLYAAPEPAHVLLRCMHELHARFPEWPPYGGAFADVIPHATIAEGVDEQRLRGEVERQLAPHLPCTFTLDEATLLEECTPDRWRVRERFPLGG
jgi:2'-5' RNA ligase